MSNIQIILVQDIDKVGKKGDLVSVKSGFARNFLIPKKLAVLSGTSEAREIVNKIKIEKQEKQAKAEVKELQKIKLEEKKKVANVRKVKLLSKK